MLSVQPADNNLSFRVVDCTYLYNLDVSSLAGVGSYTVEVVINGVAVGDSARFELR